VSDRRKRLAAAVAAIQMRWGQRALRRGPAPIPPQAVIPTGFAGLDAMLDGCGGIPRGRISELLGAPTSGMVTLALKVMAEAQAGGDMVAWLDMGHTFDPDYADRCGVDTSRLLLARPHSGKEALALVHQLVLGHSVGLIVFDAIPDLLGARSPATLAALLTGLPALLAQSPAALLCLTPLRFGGAMSVANYPPGLPLPALATLRLELRKERWLYRDNDVRGYQAQALLLKNKLGRAGQRTRLSITFNGTVRGDAT
jgi:recombination protein RecA